MNRAINLVLSEQDVMKHCQDRKIDISALEKLPDGGVRLVCSSGTGANKIRTQLRRHIIKGDVRRALFRPTSPLW